MVLLLLLAMVVAYFYWVNRTEHNYSFNDEEARLAFIEDLNNSLQEFPVHTSTDKKEKPFKQRQQKMFNPNTFSYQSLIESGVGEPIVKNIIAYRNKGGQFTTKQDVRKLYAVTSQEYERLEPFIALPDTTQKQTTAEKASKPKVQNKQPEFLARPLLIIELNAATQKELMKIKGIGPYYAKNIVKYRNLLGGFYSLSQLSEVYNLPDSVIQSISSSLIINKKNIVKLKVKEAAFKDLVKHPYLSYDETKALLNYLKQHPNATKDDLQKMHIFKDRDIEVLEHYLEF